MKTIGIVGSRRRNEVTDYTRTVNRFFEVYKDGDTMVSGGCPQGGDRFAELIGVKFNIPLKIHRAYWRRLGRAAGFIRNTDIARDADILIAVVASDRKGGTEDTIKKFLKFHPNGRLILV